MRSILLIGVVAVILAGCSNKPPPDVDSAVRNRLTRYSNAWKQGDEKGVRESFVARNAAEQDLVDAVAELAPAQTAMRRAYFEKLSPAGQTIFGEGDPTTLVRSPRPWDSYADWAARPLRLAYQKPDVIVWIHKGQKRVDPEFRLRNVAGDWKIDMNALTRSDDVAELTRSVRRQVRHTNDMTPVVGSGDAKAIQQVMLRQIHDVHGPQSESVREIVSPTTRAAQKKTRHDGG